MVRRLFFAVALTLAACGEAQPGPQALAPASPSPFPRASPPPSSVVDPQTLVQKVRGMTAIVARIDDVATKLVPSGDYLGAGTVIAASGSPAMVWVVAVVGDIRPSLGVMARPNSQCALFAFRADSGEGWSSSEGSLSLCQPYFTRSLTPADAPLRCATDAYDNGVPTTYQFSRTRAGPFNFSPVRDDRWRQPQVVGGVFLMQAPEGSVPYEDAFCLKAFVRQGPALQKLLASGVGASLPAAMPFDFAIWLRGFHATSGVADDSGHIDVLIEQRAGYEWAFFDWHALVPDGGYVMFRFRDASGREVLPWRLANGP